MTPEDLTTQNPPNFFRAVLIAGIIILLWVIGYFVQVRQGEMFGSQIQGIISIIALLATIISPLAYGWYFRDSKGAILIGALPFLLVVGILRIVSSSGLTDLVFAVVYFLSLSLVGGLAGWCAAKKTTGYLVIALLLAGIWAGIFLGGIH